MPKLALQTNKTGAHRTAPALPPDLWLGAEAGDGISGEESEEPRGTARIDTAYTEPSSSWLREVSRIVTPHQPTCMHVCERVCQSIAMSML